MTVLHHRTPDALTWWNGRSQLAQPYVQDGRPPKQKLLAHRAGHRSGGGM